MLADSVLHSVQCSEMSENDVCRLVGGIVGLCGVELRNMFG